MLTTTVKYYLAQNNPVKPFKQSITTNPAMMVVAKGGPDPQPGDVEISSVQYDIYAAQMQASIDAANQAIFVNRKNQIDNLKMAIMGPLMGTGMTQQNVEDLFTLLKM